MAHHLKRYVTCPDPIDMVIAELHPEMCEVIKSTLDKKGYPLSFLDVGHIAIVINRIADSQNIRYTDLNGYERVLQDAKQEMLRSSSTRLYQICIEEDADEVKKLLKREQFKII